MIFKACLWLYFQVQTDSQNTLFRVFQLFTLSFLNLSPSVPWVSDSIALSPNLAKGPQRKPLYSSMLQLVIKLQGSSCASILCYCFDMHTVCLCLFFSYSTHSICFILLISIDSGSRSISKNMSKLKTESALGYILPGPWIVQCSSQKHKTLFIRKNFIFIIYLEQLANPTIFQHSQKSGSNFILVSVVFPS